MTIGGYITLAFITVFAVGGILTADETAREQQRNKERAEDFACGYSVGTSDAVLLVNPALAGKREFQVPKRCTDLEDLAARHGVVRIIPRLRGPIN